MKLLFGSHHSLTKGAVLTIGNFDGVHLGHQGLLIELKKLATARQLPSVVLLFEPQPGEFFKKREAPARLSSLREKLQIFKELGIDYVCCLSFNAKLSQMPAKIFAKNIIFSALNAKYILLGEDFRFGFKREGDLSLLKIFAERNQSIIQVYSDFLFNNNRISSTQIRKLLLQGQLEEGEKLLGRPYSMCARVMPGDKRGRTLGFPTANLNIKRVSSPLLGVFCVEIQTQAGEIKQGVANIGSRPTVDGTKIILEVHIFDFDKNIYGEFLQVFFLHKLRNEVRFDSVEKLIEQIHRDVEHAKIVFQRKLKSD
jgi:riboflavin kinase/FMN adenylyltransferase